MTGPRIVVTGGPGAGKSTLIARFALDGYATRGEAGRRVIRDEIARGGDALPWGDRARFADRMLEADIEAYHVAGGDGPTFFDRGVPDVLGYLRLSGLPAPPRVEAAAMRLRYAECVFLAPFWAEIYENDAERRQSPDEARRTADVLARTYLNLGYEVVELPCASVDERLAFVLERSGLAAYARSAKTSLTIAT